ncbi:hypothetical protein EC991_004675 [Linnemannia zychae]|nr:hypothetical protein EC991_004675 [Linnemannia zychae]
MVEDPHLLPVEALSPQLFNENSSPPKQQTRRGLRRPRTLMLTSLCLWSVLLASAPRLGLNKTVSFTVYSSLGGAALDDIMLTTVPTPCSMSSAVAPVAPAVPPMTENTYSEGLTSTAWSDISEAAMDARVLSAEEDEVMESEWRLALPEETLDSMTAQQRESLSALRDFWDAMEVVVGDPYEAEEIQEEFEEQLSEQLELEYDEDREEASTTAATITQEELIQGMEEKMMDARDQIAGDDEETREVRVFQYVPVWTEVMLFAISFAVGGVVVALAQARAQTLEFLQLASAQQKRFGDEDDDEINESSSDIDADTDSEREDSASLSEKGAYQLLPSSSTKNKNKPTVIPTAFNRMLLLLALATNFWVVHCEYWDLPAFIFVGLGSTALLVHTWIIRDL